MRIAQRLLASTILAVGALTAVAPAGGQEPRAATATARQLFVAAERALGGARRAAEDPAGPVRLGGAERRSLALAFREMELALADVEAGLRARDVELYQALKRGSRSLAALRVAWTRSGTAGPAVSERLEALSASYRLLRGSYGWEGMRHAQGEPLTDAERRRFDRLRAAGRRVTRNLEPLAAGAAAYGDLALVEDLDRLIGPSSRIAAAPASLEEYLAALALAVELEAEWEATAPALPPEQRALTGSVDEAIEELLGEADDAEVGFVFATDLASGQSWAYLDETTEIPEELASWFEVPAEPTPEAVALPPVEDLVLNGGAEEGVEALARTAESIEEEDLAADEPVEGVEEVEKVEGDSEPAEEDELAAADGDEEADAVAVADLDAPIEVTTESGETLVLEVAMDEGEATEPTQPVEGDAGELADLDEPIEVTTESGETLVLDVGPEPPPGEVEEAGAPVGADVRP